MKVVERVEILNTSEELSEVKAAITKAGGQILYTKVTPTGFFSIQYRVPVEGRS